MASLLEESAEIARGTRRQDAFDSVVAFSALTNNDSSDVSQLLHTVCDKLTTPVVADMENFPLVVGRASVGEIARGITYLFSNAIASGFSNGEFEADLKKGNMSDAMVGKFSEVFQMRKVELASALRKSAQAISSAYLKDFDWSVRQIFGTNKLSNTRKAVLMLTLTVVQVSGKEVTRTFELDEKELNDMIEEFEKIAKSSRALIVP